MQSNHGKSSAAFWARGFAALSAALIVVAAGGGASADPVETVLHSFTGFPSDGDLPLGDLIADSSGNLYGTTAGGGASGNGVVFKLSPGGTETVMHSFTGGASDGATPVAGLIADSSGNLYGTTESGGPSRGLASNSSGPSEAAWCSSSRRAGPRRCCISLRAAATGAFPKPA